MTVMRNMRCKIRINVDGDEKRNEEKTRIIAGRMRVMERRKLERWER